MYACGLALTLIGLSGCATTRYLWQAAHGQWVISNRARPISELLKNEKLDPELKTLLREVGDVKRFAEQSGLRATTNFVDYVALDRPYVSYTVNACPEFSLKPKTWWFPIVGTVPYLGFFDLRDAERESDELKRQGFDARVRGVPAYSTLGWFRDPVVSSMIPRGETQDRRAALVEVVLHESVHETLYIPSSSALNESLASFVAEVLTERYMGATRAKGQDRRTARRTLWSDAYRALERLYASAEFQALPLEQRRALKRKQLEEWENRLGAEYGRVIALSNADLAETRLYESGESEFRAILAHCQGSVPRFLGRLKRVPHEVWEAQAAQDFAVVLRSISDCD